VSTFGGAAPALVTPLTGEGEVDEQGVVGLVLRALAEGAAGVLVAGSTGEGALLDPEQRAQLTRIARATIDGTSTGTTLVAGACGATVADLDADVDRLAAAGADLVLVLPPSTYPLGPEELVDLHVHVADHAEVPTLAYHIPQYTGSSLTPDAVRELAAHPNIVGMKDSAADGERRAAFVAAGRTAAGGFAVYTGHAPTLHAALEAGCDGSITAIANLRGRAVVALHEAVAAGDDETARDLQVHLARTSQALGEVRASLPAVLKAALQLDGTIAERWCRPPLRSVEGRHLDRVRTALLR
jgi:4-hydroxy-tetrahydrodipicolinate synthase